MYKHLIYLAHGNEIFLKEALFSVISFYNKNPNPDIKITIYTDSPDYFQKRAPQKIDVIPINSEIIKKWKGENDFIHLMKIEVIKDYISKHPNGKYLFLDSDTFFTNNINSVFDTILPNNFVMHKNEGSIKNSKRSHLKRLYKFLQTTSYNPNIEMWNAGVIGLDYQDKTILDKVLETTNELYPNHKSHIVEQFAFAYHFQNIGKITGTYPKIHHFWYAKQFRDSITDFFDFYKNESFEVLVEKYNQVNPEKLLHQVYEYKFGSSVTKMIIKLTTFSKGKIKKVAYK